MKIEKTWNASSRSEEFRKRNELVDMAGRWGVGIKVTIIKPYIFSQGPLNRIIIEEIRDKEVLPS